MASPASEKKERPAVAVAATSPAAAAAATPLPTAANFAVGMASGVSGWMFVHPADVVKVRMQLASGGAKGEAGAGMVSTAQGIFRQEGVTGAWFGFGLDWIDWFGGRGFASVAAAAAAAAPP